MTRDRRSDARFGGDLLGHRGATLRPGCAVTLIDLSAGGALIQGGRPLRPGARVHLQFQRAGRPLSIAAHVVRCAVWALDPQAGVTYRGALRFDDRCDMSGEGDSGAGPRDRALVGAPA